MELRSHFETLFVWDAWANREYLTALEGLPEPPEKSLKVMAHIVAAEWLWLERLRGQKQHLPVWPEFSAGQSSEEYARLPEQWRAYIVEVGARLTEPVTYLNSKGEKWTSTIHDTLTHVSTHSAYHRGQIATDLRAAGIAPPYTDYIHATRTGQVK